MKVELSIRDDKELRAHIRDCIRGEVTKIAREEIKAFIEHEIGRKLVDRSETWFENTLSEQVYNWVKRRTGAQYYGDKLTPVMREAIVEVAEKFIIPRLEKDFSSKLTNKLIKETTENIIKVKVVNALGLQPVVKK